jgi:hypothetical protein
MPKSGGKHKKALTPRQQKLLKYLAQGKSRKEAATLSGYSPKNADQSAYQALRYASQSVPQLMDELGLTDRALIENHLKPLLSAKRKKYFAHHGKVKSVREDAALDIRLDALDMTFKLKGSYAPVATESTNKNAVSVIVLDVERPKRPDSLAAIEIKPVNGKPTNGANGNGTAHD